MDKLKRIPVDYAKKGIQSAKKDTGLYVSYHVLTDMYAVSISRSFVAQHFLTVPDPGPEGVLHSHHYTVSVRITAPELNKYGYVVDIDELNAVVDAVVDFFRDETLNELPAFEGLNPSVEHLARIFGDRVLEHLDLEAATALEVAVQEDDIAEVSHERKL